jgi:hypothetical protein
MPVDFKPDWCEGCGRKLGEGITKIDAHHWLYAYETKEVRKNPNLVLNNVSWLCFTCHTLGDSLRHVMDKPVLVEHMKKIREKAINKKNVI